MANRYWVGGTANWDGTAGSKWALTSGGVGGQTVPTSADDVFFSNLSTGTCTISTGSNAKSLNCTGFTGTLTGLIASNFNVGGSITLSAGMTFSYRGTTTITATGTITSAGKSFGAITINGSAITVTLADALTTTVGSNGFTLTLGGLNLNNFTLTVMFFISNNTNVRSLAFGTGNIVIAQASGAPTLVNINQANLTVTGTKTFIRNHATGGSFQIGFSSNVANRFKLILNGGSAAVGFTSAYFDSVDFTGNSSAASGTVFAYTAPTLSATGTYTSFTINFYASATFNSIGKTIGSVALNSGTTLTLGSALTTLGVDLFQGGLILNGFTLTTEAFLCNSSLTRFIQFGSSDIVLNGATPASIALNMSTLTNFTYTGTGGFIRNMVATCTVSVGNTAGATLTNAPNLTVNAGVSALTITSGSYFKNVIFTGSACTVSGTVNIAGNLTLGSGGTYTAVNPTFLASGTVTSLFKTLGNTTINGTGITVTLADVMQVGITNTTTLTEGTLNLAGSSLDTGIFSSSNSNTRAIAFGVGNIALTSTTDATTVLSMATATNFTFTGTGGFTRNQAATATVVFGPTGGTTSNAPNLTVNAGASALTITSFSWFKNLSFTGSTCTVSNAVNMAGNLTLASGGTYTNLSPIFRVSTTFASLGKTLFSTTVDGAGITVTLADALTISTSATFTLTQGTIDLAGFTLSANRLESSNSNVRSINFGTNGSIVLTAGVANELVLMNTATNFTKSGTGGITLPGTLSIASYNFGTLGGATSSNVMDLTVSISSAGQLNFPSGSHVRSINCTGGLAFLNTISGTTNLYGNLTLASGGTYTTFSSTFLASGTITSAGKTLGNTTINGSGITVTLADAMTVGITSTTTLTQGTLALAGFTLSTGIFSSSNSNTRAISFSTENIALTSTTAATTVLSMGSATNFTYTGTGNFTRNQAATATVLFGSTAGGTVSNAPNLTVNAGASGLTIGTFSEGGFFKNLIFTGSTCSVSTQASFVNIAGNLTLASGGTYTGVSAAFIASATVTSAGKTLGNLNVNGSGITATLADALTLQSGGTLTLTQGTFTAANFNVGAGSFSSSNSSTRTLNMGSGTWTITNSGATAWNTATTTGMTLNPSTSTITMTSASAKTFAGGGLTYYNLNQGGAGALTITGSNTFNDITDTVQPSTVTFTAGTTQTVSNFSLAGTAGNLVTIKSATPGSQFTLSKSSGQVVAQYLSIQDSNATGGSGWAAYNSTNVSNNTGWNFVNNSPNMFAFLI